MKAIHYIFGVLWLLISGYLCFSSALLAYRILPDFHIMSMISLALFVVIYSADALASFYIFRKSKFARIVVAIVALFSLLPFMYGFFESFGSPLPFSPFGIAFDIFAFISFVVLLIPGKKYESA